jgi:hypothetical protein
MNLLDRYMQEVRNHLPRKMQADLELEIRSLIEDTLEDRSRTTGQNIDEELTAEVLKEFGPHEKVAAAYLPEKYLIGPQLYPAFLLTVRIVLVVIAILALIGAGISIGETEGNMAAIIESMAMSMAGLYSGALQAFGTVVLIFAIIQWARPNAADKPKAWTPSQLRDFTAPDMVRSSKPVGEIVFAVIALVVLNMYPDKLGLYSMVDGKWLFAPIFTDTFFNYIPWINLILAIKLIENVILLRRGQWQPLTRSLSIAGSIFTIALLFTMLTGPSLVLLGPETFAAFGWTVDAAERLQSLNEGLIRIILGIILALEMFDVGKMVYQLFTRKPAAQPFQS